MELTVNVLGLVDVEVTDSQFTVGGLGGTITARKVVDDESSELVAGNILQVFFDDGDTSTGVTEEGKVELAPYIPTPKRSIIEGNTYIHRNVPTSPTFKAFAARVLSVMAAAAAATSLAYSLLA